MSNQALEIMITYNVCNYTEFSIINLIHIKPPDWLLKNDLTKNVCGKMILTFIVLKFKFIYLYTMYSKNKHVHIDDWYWLLTNTFIAHQRMPFFNLIHTKLFLFDIYNYKTNLCHLVNLLLTKKFGKVAVWHRFTIQSRLMCLMSPFS